MPKTRSLFLFLIFTTSILYAQELNFFSHTEDSVLAAKILSSMTDEEKIGQVLMLGYMGDLPSDEIMSWVDERHIGGIKIFGWNADDLSNLTHTISALQKSALKNRFSIPLLIATDQEGGWVRHVRGDTSITPGNLALGSGGNLHDAWQTGYYIGLELRALGINMNFAPVVDIYLNPKADVIGPRAFSDNPGDTAMLGLSVYKGLDAAGIISTAKHFPGHGDTDKDSHGTLPRINVTLDTLKQIDLLPYRVLISEEIPAIMVGHLAFPNITSKGEPASLSRFFITDLLKNEMDYKGMIISDDLFMQGARSDGLPLGDVCEEGLRAGLDLLLVSRNPGEHEKIWNHLLSVIKDDPEFSKAVDASVLQILKTKLKYLKGSQAVALDPESADFESFIPAPGAEDFFQQQALRSVSLIRKESFPLSTEASCLLAGSLTSFFYEGRKKFPRSDFHRFNYNPDLSEIKETAAYIRKVSDNYDYVIFNLHNESSLEILKELESLEDKLIVFSVLTPVYLGETPWVKTSLAVYGTGDESFRAGFSALAGEFLPEGLVPVQMEGLSN